MKKKVVTMLLCSMVALSVTACGSKSDTRLELTENVVEEGAKAAIELLQTEVIDSGGEVLIEEPMEAPTEVELNVDVDTVDEGEIEPVDNGFKVYGKTEIDGILVNDYVLEQDKSADYGVFSTSSEDAKAFLKDDGSFSRSALDDTGKVGNYDYSGRFAYPLVQPSSRLQNLYLEYKSDGHAEYSFSDNAENQGVVTLYLGNDNYVHDLNSGTLEGYADCVEFATLKTPDGKDTLVLIRDDAANHGYSVYSYMLGAFCVRVQRNNNEPYTPAEFQEIMNNIVLQ